MTIESIYGKDEIDDPVLIALIKSPMMQRLKKLRQYGIAHYATQTPEYTRFEHSVGVMLISRRFGASLGEQIAALLHDVSHTAFSHVADYLFKGGDGNTSYQDDMHEWFINKTGINDLLAEYGYKGVCSNDNKHTFCILEQELPDLCTDRIEYNLKGGYIEGLLTVEQIAAVLRDLRFEDGRWYFVNQESALLIANVSLNLTEHIFGTRQNFFTYRQAAKALRRALDIGLLTVDDICFSHDDEVWARLCASEDKHIQCALECVKHCDTYCVDGTRESHDMRVVGKFRGVNPWIKTEQGFERLTAVNAAYKQEYDRVRAFILSGCYMTYISNDLMKLLRFHS
jgi:HD superfamily phosphohydrolase